MNCMGRKYSAIRWVSVLLSVLMIAGMLGGCGGKHISGSVSGESEISEDDASGLVLETSESEAESSDGDITESTTSQTTQQTASNDAQTSRPVDTKVSGTVNFLYPSEAKEEFETVLKEFRRIYPSITVNAEMYNGEYGTLVTQLNARAAAKKLPDIVMGTQDFGYLMKQGWVYPLDKLYEADPDKQYAFQAGLERYKFFGHLYALPLRMQFSTMVVNLDMLQNINEDEPDYNWTINDFVRLAKKATTATTAGINGVKSSDSTHSLDNQLMNSMLASPLQQYGYNITTHTFNFTNGAWAESQRLVKNLAEDNPGLVDTSSESGNNFKAGKTLFGSYNPWDFYWLRNLDWDWDYYPIPLQSASNQRIQTHVDYACMLTPVTEANRSAAYTLLKFISYDKDGSIIRTKFSIEQQSKVTGKLVLIIPASGHPDVQKYMESIKWSPAKKTGMPAGLIYMYKTVINDASKSMIADCNKVIPDFWSDVEQYRTQVAEKIESGTDPAALAQDFENKVNAASAATWKSFETKMKTNNDTFYSTHPWEK